MTQNYVGISCGFHDAALSVIDDAGNILFAGHSERYSKIKHDANLCSGLVADAEQYLSANFTMHYYERPNVKAIRQLIAGQPIGPLDVDTIIGSDISYLSNRYSKLGNTKKHSHHLSHAAAGFQTSPFNEATVVVIDAIGELDTISIWHASYTKTGFATYRKLWGQTYPNSIGLLYSAMTKRVGLKPMDEEYILMGMAAYGKPKYANDIAAFLQDPSKLEFSENLHIGVNDEFLSGADIMDIASSTQDVTEGLISYVMNIAQEKGNSQNLVYAGGVALNCAANRILGKYFNKIWIMPNPGDAGNSLGAAALGYGKKLNWTDAFLGHDITGEYPVDKLVNSLYKDKIVGVASGRAEFGPRALGNRSLLADPRDPEIKDKVNAIKQRQKFRPFAPVILEELASDYFVLPRGWDHGRYMQFIAPCRFPDLYPSIVHIDGTSRIHTVPKGSSGIRKLLEEWYKLTGSPILLNTSLNIRGEPMVNDLADADRFQKEYGIQVWS